MHVFRLAKVAEAEHEEHKKEDMQLQFMMCDLKLAQAIYYVMCVETCKEHAASGIIRQNILVLFFDIVNTTGMNRLKIARC